MIETLVLFGATGDLAGRFLLPALARLGQAGRLPDGFQVVGSAYSDGDDDTFRAHARAELEAHAPDLPAEAAAELIPRLHYHQADATDAESVAAVLRRAEGSAVAAYLALPVGLVPDAIKATAAGGLAAGSRLVIEKPFGADLREAEGLNALLAEVTAGSEGSIDVFRVDNVLGMEPLWNILALRFANGVLETAWDAEHIERVDVLWEESLALEGRATYYDGAGALRDVVQNHVMHVLSLFAMEEPLRTEDLRERKTDVLRAVRMPTAEQAAARSRRGRYTAGRLADDADGQGQQVPSYVDEDGVDPARATETFAELTLSIDTPRWEGTSFVLRAGKALSARRKGVLVHFRAGQGSGFCRASLGGRMWLGVDGPNDVRFDVMGMSSPLEAMEPLVVRSEPYTPKMSSYCHVLLDILRGGQTLSVDGAEAEAAWRVVDPVLEAWERGLVPLQDYSAGSAGPSSQAT